MRLVVVSNRVSVPSEGDVHAGGMTVGIDGALGRFGGLWLGWSGRLTRHGSYGRHRESSGGVDYVTLDVPDATFKGYYSGFANQVLWPLFHHRPDLVVFDRGDFGAYLAVNERFADELARLITTADILWVHDYHLIPLAQAMRRRGVGNRIGFFLHTPFADPAHLMRLPVRDALAECFAAYDLMGFQTQADVRSFRGFMAAQSWASERHPMRRLETPHAEAFPIGIDFDRFIGLAETEISDARLKAAFEKLEPQARPIIAVDRLDYSKGIPERLCGFDGFLTLHPEHAGRVGLIQVAPVSRSAIPAYQAEARRVEQAYAALRAAHDWGSVPPVQLITDGVDRASLAAAYRRSPVALVTPLRDGMNLVAKEYVAAQDAADPGVLVLSRHAGASEELAGGALIVDPRDGSEVAEALHRALSMGRRERQARWRAMIEPVRRNDAGHWSRRFLDALADVDIRREPAEPEAHRRPEPAWSKTAASVAAGAAQRQSIWWNGAG